METIKKIILILIKIVLGGILIYGGIKKFAKPMPQPDKYLQISAQEKAEVLENPDELKIHNYVFGLKQSGFFWQFLGIAEILAGILLVTQIFSFIGALIAFPQMLNIFFFHLFLEPHEKGELVLMALYLFINIVIIAAYF